MDEDEDDDGVDDAVTISSPSPAEIPESPASQVQNKPASSSPVSNNTWNQHENVNVELMSKKAVTNSVKGQMHFLTFTFQK